MREAMKLYLDMPGIVFVLACDGDVVLRAVREMWDQAGPENLLELILLQQFHPDFYRLFVNSLDTEPIGDFLAYRDFRLTIAAARLERQLPAEFMRLGGDAEFASLLAVLAWLRDE
jgi:hypothetical protein